MKRFPEFPFSITNTKPMILNRCEDEELLLLRIFIRRRCDLVRLLLL